MGQKHRKWVSFILTFPCTLPAVIHISVVYVHMLTHIIYCVYTRYTHAEGKIGGNLLREKRETERVGRGKLVAARILFSLLKCNAFVMMTMCNNSR